jgi:hypothetical protein
MSHPIQQRLAPLRTLFDILGKDFKAAVGKSKTKLSQSKRRSLIRALFAWIEADTFNRKQIALILQEEGLVEFSLPETALLREEQYALGKKGEVRTEVKFLRLAENLQFAVYCFCKATSIQYEVPKGGPGWEAFRRAIELRNRITHPKSPAALFISDEDMKDVWKTFLWFKNNSEEIAKRLAQKYDAG